MSTKFKFRKGMKIGGLAAESDELLHSAFVDLGFLDSLIDTADHRFLILGRAGSGKTALLERIRKKSEHVSTLDPDDLSMQYLHNSQVLRTIASWGVNLEVFYKYLWRHVCILELIRMKYGDAADVPTKIQQVFDFAQLWKKDERKTRELSQEYLQKYGKDYWIKTDTRIKTITTEIESRLTSDPSISASLGCPGGSISARLGQTNTRRTSDKIEKEVVDRAQSIVSDFQLATLTRVIELLEKHGFNDEQNKYYILIDDLDKNWMPDDDLYLHLVKSLLFTVADLNRKLQNVKIIVALRENIYHRVFQKASKHEPQREKWLDVQVRLHWTKDDLLTLVNRRLREVLRGEYTLDPPTLTDILPEPRRRYNERAEDFIIQRTFLRPRDMIDFMNTVIAVPDSFSRLTWANLTRAEAEFSQRRLQSVFDEWRDSYFGLPACFPLLRRLGTRFSVSEVNENDVFRIFEDPRAEQCEWLSGIRTQLLEGQSSWREAMVEILKALYLVGVIGVKQADDNHVLYSFDRAFNYFPATIENAEFYTHKMFWNALNIGTRFESNATTAGDIM